MIHNSLSKYLVYVFLIIGLSITIIAGQELLYQTGNVVFNGHFDTKILQLYSIIFTIILITLMISIFFRNYIFKKNFKMDKFKTPLREVNFGIGQNIKFIAIFFTIIFYLYIFIQTDRFSHDGSERELFFYALMFTVLYAISYFITKDFLNSFVFPILAFVSFVVIPIDFNVLAVFQHGISGITPKIFNISADMYHSGETYITGRLFQSGQLGMFSEYNPSRGLSNYYGMLIAALFGNVDRFEMYTYYSITAIRIIFATFAFVLLIRVRFIVRVLFALITGFLASGGMMLGVSLILPMTWFVVNKFDINKPVKTSGIITIGSLFFITQTVGLGAVWTLAVALFTLTSIWSGKNIVKNYNLYQFLLPILFGIALILILIFTTPNLLIYIQGNGSINISAHGILQSIDSYSSIKFGSVVIPPFLISCFILLKYGFIILTPLIIVSFMILKNYDQDRQASFCLIITAIILLGLVRFMGRDDLFSLSRPFGATVLAGTSLAFIILNNLSNVRITNRIISFGMMAFLIVVTLILAGNFVSRAISSKSNSLLDIQFVQKLPDNVQNSISSINQFIELKAYTCRNFVDLTGNNSIYAFEQRLTLIPTTSTYNMASISEQKLVIERLEALEADGGVCVRMIYKNTFHDGGGQLLRAPILSNYIYKNYIPVDVGKNVENIGFWMESPHDEVKNDRSIKEELNYAQTFFNSFDEIFWLPSTWGSKITGRLEGDFDLLNSTPISLTQKSQLTVAKIYNYLEQDRTSCSLTRHGSDGSTSSISFFIQEKGFYLVPIYGNSHWYFNNIERISLECPEAGIIEVSCPLCNQ